MARGGRVMRYRITEPEIGLFAPEVRYGFWWRRVDGLGREMSFGCRWSGPLEDAAAAVRAHMIAPGRKVSPGQLFAMTPPLPPAPSPTAGDE